jgi:hypothetical protein
VLAKRRPRATKRRFDVALERADVGWLSEEQGEVAAGEDVVFGYMEELGFEAASVVRYGSRQ